MPDSPRFAPGWPGITPTWTSSAKCGIGTSAGRSSPLWYTLSHGIVNEVYFPRLDTACIRDLQLIVTDGESFFSEEKRHTESTITLPEEGIPLYRMENACREGRYRIEKEILSDPARPVLLQRVRFQPLTGPAERYRLHVLLAPHLHNRGSGNTAWCGDYKGVPMLFARRHGYALALASSLPWRGRSAGFSGPSDGWQDLVRHFRMTWFYDRAENGNVALTGEIALEPSADGFLLALGFGENEWEAGQRARSSILEGFDAVRSAFVEEWRRWQEELVPLERRPRRGSLFRTSAMVLKSHESKAFPGGLIASLSVPWGQAKGDDDLGGYHLLWPRDLVETAGGLLALGARRDARRVLRYLQTTQCEDGHWPQNMWLDGNPYWQGVQLDETAFPVLLCDLALRNKALGQEEAARLWPMVRSAAAFLVQNGPVTQQDRWEEDPGYSPFTLAVTVAALLAAAEWAEGAGEGEAAAYLRETADAWNDSIERWTFATGTDLAAELGVSGYYVRIAPPDSADACSPVQGFVPIKNRPIGQSAAPAAQILSPDALALVRFGLRAPDDPRILDTLRALDARLRVVTPAGPCWKRYSGDGYGEHEDGSPFDGTGVGRPWPLLTGERAHYELAAGRREEARRLLHTMEALAGTGGMLPEQVWDGADIPARELFLGRPSGSAMPLAWAHAEYLKLLRSLKEGRIFDLPPQTAQRYLRDPPAPRFRVWRFGHRCRRLEGRELDLRIETLQRAVVHWSTDDWASARDTETRSTGLGIHVADLPAAGLPEGTWVRFTFYWPDAARWEGEDFEVEVG